MCTYLDQVGPTYYFRRSVPIELQALILTATGKPRTEFKISLRTKDRETAKRLLPDYVKMSDQAFDVARAKLATDPLDIPSGPASLPFNPFAGITEDEFERQQYHAREVGREIDAQDERMERASAWAARLPADHDAVLLLKEIGGERDNYRDRYRRRKRRDLAAGESQGGETSSTLQALPKLENASQRTPQDNSAAVTITGLFKGHVNTGALSPAIVNEWTAKVDRFVAFVGHDDATLVTTDNIRDWRNHVRDEALPGDKRRSAQTVNAGYLSPIRSAFKYGISEGLIPHDPAKDVARVSPIKAPKIRDKDFTKDEQRIILAAASAAGSRPSRT